VLFAVPALILASLVSVGGYELLVLASEEEATLESLMSHAPLVVVIQLIWWSLLMGFMYAVVSLKYRLPFAYAIGWRRVERSPWIYLPYGALLAAAVAVTSQFLPMPSEPLPIEELFGDRLSLILLSVFGVLIAPVVEELVFRGFFFTVIEQSHGPLAAVLATSAFFSVLHARQYGWHWQNLLLLALVGIVFGAVRARTQSVVPSTMLHAGYNATLFAGMFAAGDQLFQ
jgi:membrane protease YdiL (CAAX protease family)